MRVISLLLDAGADPQWRDNSADSLHQRHSALSLVQYQHAGEKNRAAFVLQLTRGACEKQLRELAAESTVTLPLFAHRGLRALVLDYCDQPPRQFAELEDYEVEDEVLAHDAMIDARDAAPRRIFVMPLQRECLVRIHCSKINLDCSGRRLTACDRLCLLLARCRRP